jgi:type 1 glutamine amidotransferase
MPEPVRTLLLSGGPHHPFDRTSPAIADMLHGAGKFAVSVTTDVGELNAERLAALDLLAINACLPVGHYPSLTTQQKQAILRFVEDGKGLFSIHSGAIVFNDWPEFTRIVGGFWEDGRSAHGPYQPGYEIHVVDGGHPVTRGIADFEIHDELYHTLTMTAHVHVLMTAFCDGRIHPTAWTREVGRARVHYNALGHGWETFENETFRELLLRGFLWTARLI